jgi:putative ABC transport system substrate-binding protein
MVGILLSREIGPYVSMVEGLESRLRTPSLRFFLDESGRPYSLGGRNATLNPQQYDVLVAVGPEALQYLQSRAGAIPLVHGMVLNPRKLITDPQWQPCGVGLGIPAESQFTSILRYLPAMKRLGVLFDPANNQAWFKDSSVLAAVKGLELVPLQVSMQGGKLEMVGDFARLDAILFIPDKSIISKAVIQYVIKQGVLSNTPVIGYNQFFRDSGAALNFLIDYRRVGQQVARQVEQLLSGDKCQGESAPLYETVVNDEVWRALKKGKETGARSQNE